MVLIGLTLQQFFEGSFFTTLHKTYLEIQQTS